MKMLSTTTVVLPTCLIKVWSYFQLLAIETWLTAAFYIYLLGADK